MLKGYLLTNYVRRTDGKMHAGSNIEYAHKRDAKRAAMRMIKATPSGTERSMIVDCRKTGRTVFEVSGNCDSQTVMTDDSL